jgi:hypothetical protein
MEQGEGRTGVADETDSGAGTAPRAATSAVNPSLRLSGYDSPKALADALAANWTDAVAVLSDGAVEAQVRTGIGDAALADAIAEIAKDGSVAEDTRLFRVILRMDPQPNPRFMDYEMSEQGLVELAAEVDGPFPTWGATAALRIMYTDRVLTLCADATKTPRFRELDDRWHEEFESWTRLTAKSKEAGGPDVSSKVAWRNRAKILRGLLDTKGDETLRASAREAMQKPTVAEWSKGVGSLEGAGVGTLMGVSDLGGAADVYDVKRRTERKKAASSKRRGIISGVVTVLILGGVVYGIAAFARGSNQEILFSPSASASPTAAFDIKTAPILQTAVAAVATDLLDEAKDGAKVIQNLPELTRLYIVSHEIKGFYAVRLYDDETIDGYIDVSSPRIICAGKCGVTLPSSTPSG